MKIPLLKSGVLERSWGGGEVLSMADVFFDGDNSSRLLCDESKDLCFDDLDAATATGGSNDKYPNYSSHGSDPVIIPVPVRSDESFSLMLEREREYLPKEDYLWRLRSGELDLNFRRQAFDWIWKAHAYYCFGPLSLCLSMNYLDRFLSLYDLSRDKAWAVQLLAVACLSIAVKMEETNVPRSIELQVADPKFVFEAETIERMELLVLSTLNWRMNALTSCSFVDYFLDKITDDNPIPTKVIDKSVQLILCTIRGLDFLEFKPSEVAAAVAISVAGDIQAVNIDKVISASSSSFSSTHVQKDRVVKCLELIKDMSLMRIGSTGFSLPDSPVGVLEAGCFSNRSDDITVGSCANSSCTSADTNRKRLDHSVSGVDSSKS